MKLPRRRFLQLAGAAVAVTLLTLSGHGAWSQTTRTIKIIVPTPPGGALDTLARLVAEQIGHTRGPTLVIENRPGAGTVIGTEAAARAVPDGNTLLVASTPFVISPHLRKLNYDPLISFTPICIVTTAPIVIVVNSASRYRTLAELLDAARAKPGDLTLAGPAASAAQTGFEMLKRVAKVDMTFVPYPGNAPAVNALLGEHVTSFLGNYKSVHK